MKIQQAKINSVLSKKYVYPEGIMTRKEWIELKKSSGANVFERPERETAKEEKERENLLFLRKNMPWGNPNHPDCKEWAERTEILEKGFFKTVYRLEMGNSLWSITKIEFDYFNSL